MKSSCCHIIWWVHHSFAEINILVNDGIPRLVICFPDISFNSNQFGNGFRFRYVFSVFNDLIHVRLYIFAASIVISEISKYIVGSGIDKRLCNE